jgi:hypothetical protein
MAKFIDPNSATITLTVADAALQCPETFYSAGHVLDANEANALNQKMRLDLRALFAPIVKEGNRTPAELQKAFDQLVDSYEFGMSRPRRAFGLDYYIKEIGRDAVKAALRKKGVKVAGVKVSEIDAILEKILAKSENQWIVERAKARMAEETSLDLDIA